MPGFASAFPVSMRRSVIFWDETLLKPIKNATVFHGHVHQIIYNQIENISFQAFIGVINGATKMASMTTEVLLATNPKLVIKVNTATEI